MGLRSRLTLWSVIGIAALSVVALLTINVLLGRQTEERLDAELVEQVGVLQHVFASAANSSDILSVSRDFLAGASSEALRLAGLVVLVSDGKGGLVSNSDRIRLEDLQMDAGAPEGLPVSVQTPLGWYRVAQVPILFDSQEVGTIRIAAPLEEALAARREVVVLASILLACGIVLLSASAWLLIGRALAPVRRITESASEISHHDLSRRVPSPGPNDDIGHLVATINGMLDRLEAAFKEQEQFISDVSHELRTPLTIAKGHLQVLDRAKASSQEAIREGHMVVLDELGRMNRLLDELSTLARAGRFDFLREEWVDVDSLLSGLATQGRALAPDRQWQISLSHGPRVLVDQDRLTQVFLNLMQNAITYTEPGQCVVLGAGPNGKGLELWVEDAGAGMGDDVQKRIFERFYRGPAAAHTHNHNPKGMGLGLAIVDAIVRAHGGLVSVESRLGAGSRFRIVLPPERVRFF